MIINCKFDADNQFFRIDPFPGSVDARMQGCSCPVQQPWPGGAAFDDQCHVHQLDKVKPN